MPLGVPTFTRVQRSGQPHPAFREQPAPQPKEKYLRSVIQLLLDRLTVEQFDCLAEFLQAKLPDTVIGSMCSGTDISAVVRRMHMLRHGIDNYLQLILYMRFYQGYIESSLFDNR